MKTNYFLMFIFMGMLCVITLILGLHFGKQEGYAEMKEMVNRTSHRVGFQQGIYYHAKTKKIDHWSVDVKDYINSNYAHWSNWVSKITVIDTRLELMNFVYEDNFHIEYFKNDLIYIDIPKNKIKSIWSPVSLPWICVWIYDNSLQGYKEIFFKKKMVKEELINIKEILK
jgi:hypothetical protein